MSWLTEVKTNNARDIIEGRPIDVLQRQYGSPIPRSSSPTQNDIIRQEIEKPSSPYGPPRARDIIMGIRRYDPADEPKYRARYRERPVTPTQVEYDRVEYKYSQEHGKANGRYSPPKDTIIHSSDYDELLREKDRKIDFLTHQLEDMKKTWQIDSLGSGSTLEISKYRDEIAYLKRENERLHEENLRLLERLGKNDIPPKVDEGRVSWVNSFGKESAALTSTSSGSSQPRRPFLGVEVKAEDHTGQNLLVVHNVISGSPAAVAGILPGDVIRTWNGKQLASKSHFQKLLNESIGLNVNLGVNRAGKTTNLNVIISGTAGAPTKRPNRSRTPP